MISAPEKVLLFSEVRQDGISKGTFAEEYPIKILIADDNYINQKLIERILYKLGYQIDKVANGIQVLNSFCNKEYNVILMDIRMPEMDGLETTQRIRQMMVEQPYIIAMTANAMSGDREECFQKGMDDYISKPVCINELISKLKIAAGYLKKRK